MSDGKGCHERNDKAMSFLLASCKAVVIISYLPKLVIPRRSLSALERFFDALEVRSNGGERGWRPGLGREVII